MASMAVSLSFDLAAPSPRAGITASSRRNMIKFSCYSATERFGDCLVVNNSDKDEVQTLVKLNLNLTGKDIHLGDSTNIGSCSADEDVIVIVNSVLFVLGLKISSC
ncbi:hypothetical protein J5N97_017192 [Dioscorea zingiberensis]|uniref:Uncharacterized protein n=1 Tax=Dioscorea zingiberensis TaxID=325984 RepID=A0A9D5HGC0_9LILI|nr:hypothetical protein J5N97_017192 [Dioscorea zingiberensis]